jgi:hypothetical protein
LKREHRFERLAYNMCGGRRNELYPVSVVQLVP